MLLLNKTLMKLARGSWPWILAIAGVGFLTLMGTTALAEIIAGFLGDLFQPQTALATAGSAVLAAGFTFLMQLLKGLLEYKAAARARESMRRQIFSKVLELDAGGIEKIGPVSAITASVDAVEQMQAYVSSYFPSLIYSAAAPVYLFFHLKKVSLPVAALVLAVALVLFPVNDLFCRRIEEIRKGYWKSLDDMTGYYMDSLRGLTTLKLFDRDREHSRILGEKADILNQKHQPVHEDQFHLLFGDRADDLWGHRGRAGRFRPGDRPGDITIAQGLVVLMLAYSYFSSAQRLMSASRSALTAISAAGKVEEILDMDTSRPCDRPLPADPVGFDGIRMEHVSYGYEGRSRALNDVSLAIPRGAVAAFPGFFVSLARILILVCAGVLTARGTDDPVGTIEFRDVTFAYPGTDKNILEHFSYTVRKGDRVGIAGESGAGKSTILRLLLRFYAPTAGEIRINGIPLEQISFAELHRRIAFLEQDTYLFDATIAENIGIARVLLRDPDVRLMDEPSSALDALHERELLHTLETEYAGKTLPLISHRQSTLAGCTRLLKMEQGKAIPQ